MWDSSELVVVLPCAPATVTARRPFISNARMSLRCTMRMPRSCAATISGLSGLMALEYTTVSAPRTLSACWPISTVMPRDRSRSVFEPSSRSEPSTSTPRSWSISASTLIPAPPMPMKWVLPSCNTVASGANATLIGSRTIGVALVCASDTADSP